MAGHSVPVDFKVNPAKISNPGQCDIINMYKVNWGVHILDMKAMI